MNGTQGSKLARGRVLGTDHPRERGLIGGGSFHGRAFKTLSERRRLGRFNVEELAELFVALIEKAREAGLHDMHKLSREVHFVALVNVHKVGAFERHQPRALGQTVHHFVERRLYLGRKDIERLGHAEALIRRLSRQYFFPVDGYSLKHLRAFQEVNLVILVNFGVKRLVELLDDTRSDLGLFILAPLVEPRHIFLRHTRRDKGREILYLFVGHLHHALLARHGLADILHFGLYLRNSHTKLRKALLYDLDGVERTLVEVILSLLADRHHLVEHGGQDDIRAISAQLRELLHIIADIAPRSLHSVLQRLHAEQRVQFLIELELRQHARLRSEELCVRRELADKLAHFHTAHAVLVEHTVERHKQLYREVGHNSAHGYLVYRGIAGEVSERMLLAEHIVRHYLVRVVVADVHYLALAEYFQRGGFEGSLVGALGGVDIARGIRRLVGIHRERLRVFLRKACLAALKAVQLRFCDYGVRVVVAKLAAVLLKKL